MIPGSLSFTIRQGDTFSAIVTLKNATSVNGVVTPGTPLDLTGCQAEMDIRDTTKALILGLRSVTPTANNSKLTLGGTAGTVDIAISALDSVNLKSGVYDLRIQFADQTIQTFIAGKITVSPQVTQWI